MPCRLIAAQFWTNPMLPKLLPDREYPTPEMSSTSDNQPSFNPIHSQRQRDKIRQTAKRRLELWKEHDLSKLRFLRDQETLSRDEEAELIYLQAKYEPEATSSSDVSYLRKG